MNVPVHTNPFAPDPQNPFTGHASQELEPRRAQWSSPGKSVAEITRDIERVRLVGEELERRGDVDRAVELWERLCEVTFVRGETQGHYTHSTAYLSPENVGSMHRTNNVYRMPDTAEIEALVLSDGEETAYPPHDAQPAYDPSIPDLTAEQRAETYYHESENPWSGDDRLYPITLTLISCGDYHGSDLDAANNRTLQGTPGVNVSEPNTGGQGSVFSVSTTVVGEMSSFENSQTTADWECEPAARRADALMWLESLVTQMERLVEYPFLDEEAHSEFITELAEEAWSNHLESDTRSDLESMAPAHHGGGAMDAVSLVESDSLREAYFSFEENEWSAESATSVVNGRHNEAVKHVARTLFGWPV